MSKNASLVLWIIALVVSILYIGYIVLRYGVTSSISSSIHKLETSVKKSLYSWFIFGVALPMMLISNNTMGFLAGAFLMLDFAAVSGGDKLQGAIHMIGANVGMLLGVAMLGFVLHLWVLVGVIVVAVGLIYFLKAKHGTWWIEIAVLIGVLIGLMYKIINLTS
jgi:hypothetical protein